jgi:hypothetical protein
MGCHAVGAKRFRPQDQATMSLGGGFERARGPFGRLETKNYCCTLVRTEAWGNL